MSNRLTTMAAVLALLLGLWAFYRLAEWSSRAGEEAPLYSVRRHDPYGAAALLDLLSERGGSVRRLERPRLEPGDRGTLIQVLPIQEQGFFSGRRPPRVDPRRLIEWIGQGNTVVQLTRARTELMALAQAPFGVFPSVPAGTAAATQPAVLPPPHGATVQQVEQDSALKVQRHEAAGKPPEEAPAARVEARLEEQEDQAAQRLVCDAPQWYKRSSGGSWRVIAHDGERVVAAESRIGRGRLIIVGAPTPALNHGLLQGDNLPFMLALLGDDPVIFDEWSHGIGSGGTLMGLIRRVGLAPVILQALFVVGLYHWSTRGHRPREIDPPARRRASAEQIETLGHLYAQSLQPDVTHGLVYDEVQRRMAAALRCRPNELAQKLEKAPPALARKGRELLAALRAVQHEHRPVCLACGYDLTHSTGARCPECGVPIPPRLRERVALASLTSPATPVPSGETHKPQRRPPHWRLEHELARVLSLSHEFAREASRDRGPFR